MDANPLDEEFASAMLQTALEFFIPQDPSATGTQCLEKADPRLAEILIKTSDAGPTISPHNKIGNQAGTGGVVHRICTRNHGQKKAELEYLCRDVKMLEARLDRLKKASVPQLPSEDDTLVRSSYFQGCVFADTWKMMAVRQYHRRKQSKTANRDLKRALSNELKIANTLDRFLHRLRQTTKAPR